LHAGDRIGLPGLSPARLIEAQEEIALAFETLTYRRHDRVATITLNRPERLNAIIMNMPAEIRAAVEEAKGVPKNQLWMQKTAISAFENMGMRTTQTLATLFDGMTRHSPEGLWFKQRAEAAGFHQAVRERDSGDPLPGSKPPRNN
jgi:hypothetical protein